MKDSIIIIINFEVVRQVHAYKNRRAYYLMGQCLTPGLSLSLGVDSKPEVMS